jgi:hypothetical protein
MNLLTNTWMTAQMLLKHESPKRRWRDDIKADFKETGCQNVDWIQLAQDRDRLWPFLNTVMNFRVS